ncbi:MAG: putative bifunctional diguanylate cyclase/phosphodiesterase [Gammaproteobacteria bacterium]
MSHQSLSGAGSSSTFDRTSGATATGGYARVLVAEDDQAARFLLREALEQAGFFVEEAANGAIAVQRFKEAPPDIVLVDVMMPELDGFETCDQLRREPGGRHVPIVMMTGLDDLESIKHAYEVGATDFITKPFAYEVLTQRVRYMVRAKRTADELRRTATELRESEARLEQAQRIARLGHWEWNIDRNRMRCSREFCTIFGFESDASSMDCEDLITAVHPDDRQFVRDAMQAAIDDGTAYKIEFRIRREDGSERVVTQEAEAVNDEDGNAVRIMGTAQDTTERRRAEEQVRYLAYYDNVTGLPNRTFLREQLRSVLATARRKDEMIGVLFLDLDGFKLVNDTLGHSAGDLLLQNVAQRLGECVREGDQITRLDSEDFEEEEPWLDPNVVARLGGDEFVILLTNITRSEEAGAVAVRIANSLARPFELDGEKVYISTSVGISLYPQDGTDEDTLLKHADAAMYEAKGRGRGGHQFYAEMEGGNLQQRLALETELNDAIEHGQFVLYYQPKIGLAQRELVGLEALVRWQHPRRGLLEPTDFIAVAEDSGLLVQIGAWALRSACEQQRRWVADGLAPVQISINVSERQLRDPAFMANLSGTINGLGVDASCFQIEVTEAALMGDVEASRETLEAVSELGLSVAIDDFGTGHFSLGLLKGLPVDALKVDGSFVAEMANDAHSRAVIQATISLAHNLGLKVVAEAVESEAQIERLLVFGCDEAQGRAVCAPLPVSSMNAYLAQSAVEQALRSH